MTDEIPDYDFAAMTDDQLVDASSLPMYWSQVAEYQAELERRGINLYDEGTVRVLTEYVIAGPNDALDDEPLYWSNADGWVSFDTATRFTEAERSTVTLPIEATGWVAVALRELDDEGTVTVREGK